MADLNIVLGMGDLLKKLDELPKKLRNKGTRKAVTAAGKPVARETKARVRVRTGLLRQAITNKVIKLQSGDYAVLTGAKHLKGTKKKPKPGFKINKKVKQRMEELGIGEGEIDPVRYLHLVELGTPHSAPQAPLQRGLKAARSQANTAMANVLLDVIEGRL